MARTVCSFVIIALIAPVAGFSAAHAADPNGYTAQFECRAGNPNCDVDVASLGRRQCDQTIAPSTPWSAINWSSNTICIQAGDHTGKGTLNIPNDANGTPGNYKVLRYTSADNNDDDPWNQAPAAQARLFRLVVDGADYWLIHRLTFPSNSVQHTSYVVLDEAEDGNPVSHVIVNRLLVEGPGLAEVCQGGIVTSGDDLFADTLTVQNSVVRNLLRCSGGSPVAVSMSNGRNHRIVNNQIYNWCEHEIQIGQDNIPDMPDVVVENNDLYKNGDIYDSNGNAAGGWLVSMKARGTSSDPVRVIHNRLSGSRPQNGSLCGTPDSGHAAGGAANAGANNEFVLYQNNIITDSHGGIAFYNFELPNQSIIGNIFFDITPKGTTPWSNTLSFYSSSASEAYLNTVVASRTGEGDGVFGEWAGHSDLDIRCNVFLDSEGSGTTPGSTSTADYNVFYATPPFAFNGGNHNIDNAVTTRVSGQAYGVGQILRTAASTNCNAMSDAACYLYKVIQSGTSAGAAYCAALGCETTDGTLIVKAIRGPYEYRRNLKTVNGGESKVIPYVRVHVDADEASFCPGAGQADALGSRGGIGVNDDIGWSGIFTTDLTATTRDGTAGALQKAGSGGGGGGQQTPYPGPNPAAIPGTIEAENFDNGGEGVAYHDTETTNWGGGYRQTGVDIETAAGAGNGYYVCCAYTGEWLEYTVDVAAAGSYTLELLVASNGPGGTFHVEFAGVDKTGPITVPNTGGWQAFQMLTPTVSLNAGVQIMRLAMDSNGPTNAVGNFDFIRLTALSGSTPYPGPNPAAIPGTVQAEDFDNGGEGVAYHDTEAVNWGNDQAYRPNTGVDLEASANADNGRLLCCTYAGEWLNYSVNVASAGSYTLQMPVASNGQGGTFHIEIGGIDKTGPVTIPNTGGWSAWQTLTRAVDLAVGVQIMRVVMDAEGPTGAIGNFDYFRFTGGSATGAILREYWLGIPGEAVSDLTGNANYPNNPSGSDQLTIFEAPIDWAEEYGTRIRGYVHPPASGNYTFWIAADDNAELWLSTDADPGNKVRIAFIAGWTDSRQWDKFASQQSVPISLTAGQTYYIEALQKEGGGGDNLAVGWQLPSGTLERPIPGSRLSAP